MLSLVFRFFSFFFFGFGGKLSGNRRWKLLRYLGWGLCNYARLQLVRHVSCCMCGILQVAGLLVGLEWNGEW